MVFESKLFGHEIDMCLPQATGNCVVFLACYKASRHHHLFWLCILVFMYVQMTEFKTMKMETDKAHREKIENMQKRHSTAMDTLQVSTPVLKH